MNASDFLVFNAETCPKETGGTDRVASVSVSTKTGVIYISKRTSGILGLDENQRVSFVNSKSEPLDWFIVKDEKGFVIKFDSARKSLRVHHKGLCSKIMESIGVTKATKQRFLLAGKPTAVKGDSKVYYALLKLNNEV